MQTSSPRPSHRPAWILTAVLLLAACSGPGRTPSDDVGSPAPDASLPQVNDAGHPHDAGPADAGAQVACAGDQQGCASQADCCAGLNCQLGTCSSAPSCGSQSASCAQDSDCCAGLSCAGGVCGVRPTCASNGATCDLGQTIVCCGVSVCNPNARACCVTVGSGSCMSNSDCCSGSCVGGACQAVAPGGACAYGNDCASGGTCVNGACMGDGPDAGNPDAGSSDAGSPDAGQDGGSVDAGSPLPAYPGVTPAQLATETPTQLSPSTDGVHVAFSTAAAPGGFSSACGGDQGAGWLGMATVGASEQQLSSNGSLGQSGFTADGLHFVWADYQGPDGSDCTPVVMSSAPDGTGAKQIGQAFRATSTAVWFDAFAVVGNSAFWLANWYPHVTGDPAELDGTLVSGGTQQLFGSSSSYIGSSDPTGMSLYYRDSGGSYLASVKTGTKVSEPAALSAWSPDGSHFALCNMGQLTVMTSAGANVTPLGACGGASVRFSPDGTSVAYDVATNVLVQPIAGGTGVTLSGLATGQNASKPGLGFLTSRWLLVDQSVSAGTQLLVGDAQNGGALLNVSSSIYGNTLSDAAETHLAFTDGNSAAGHVRVVTLASGTVTDVGVFGSPTLAYESTGAGLLAVSHDSDFQTGIGAIELYSNEGTTHVLTAASNALLSTPFELNDLSFYPPRPFWAGKVLVYAVNPRLGSSGKAECDLAAVSEDGQVTGVLATGVIRVVPLAGTSRVFFVRSGDAGGGLWVLDVP